MKPKIRMIIEHCLECGVRRGYRKAHKYVENPDEESICCAIEEAIMGELYEWFDFTESE